MPGHLSELQPVNAVNTKGQFLRASFGKNPRIQIQLDKWPLSGASHGGSEKPGKLEVGGASRDSTGLGALEEGLISS